MNPTGSGQTFGSVREKVDAHIVSIFWTIGLIQDPFAAVKYLAT
jgi:hypothetical protein